MPKRLVSLKPSWSWEFGGYIQLLAIDELVWANRIPQKETHDRLVVFGDDGSRELFGFDFRSEPPPVAMVCITSSGWKDAVEQAPTFSAFLKRMESVGADFGPDGFDAMVSMQLRSL